ncbi:MAG: hypothetical protein DSZ25_02575 [Thermovibrio sp.]|nr:MAG: hypothetical protein DSZ25_02575 [Thermovibrio sp.]
MATSINEDITIGRTKFHVQTEFYRSSGKVVSNIFKDGIALKRVERSLDEDEEIEEAVQKFHREVVQKLLSGAKPKKKGKFSLPEELIDEVIKVISPYFGIASAFIIEEAISSASSKESFINELLGELSGKEREELSEKLKRLLTEDKTEEVSIDNLKEEILSILGEFFGIMAVSIFEETLEELNSNSLEEFIEKVSSQLEGKEREGLKERLRSLSSKS